MLELLKSVWDNIKDILFPEVVEIYKRMDKLFAYIELADLNKLEKITVQPIRYNAIAEETSLSFESNLGLVKIDITKQFNGLYSMEYANYAGTTVFELKTGPFWVEVVPMLGDELTAKDVDLAIYELEKYLYNNLGDIENIQKRQELIFNRKKDLHKKELTLLERGENATRL